VKITKQLKQILVIMTLPILATVSAGVNAAEPPPTPVMESFACSYNPGKDMDDLLAARDYLVKQAAKAGIALRATYVWSLFKGNAPIDFVWLTPHDSLAAYAAGVEANAGNSDMAGVGARFDAVADCATNLANLNAVYQGEGPTDTAAPAFVSAFSCNAKPGVGPAQMADLRNHIGAVVGTLGDDAPRFMFTSTPITNGANSPDVRLFAVNDSISDWASFNAAVGNSAGGPQLLRHFGMVLDCGQALFTSQQVVSAPAD
jgi:hypothetical protein